MSLTLFAVAKSDFSNGSAIGSTQVAYGDAAGKIKSDAAFTRGTLTLNIDPNTDNTFQTGYGKMGFVTSGTSGTFYLGNSAAFNTTDYALRCGTVNTFINASAVGSVFGAVGGSTKTTLNNTSFTFASGVPVTISDPTAGGLTLGGAGGGISIKSGSNARCGTATLVAGTVTVANTSVTANTRVMCTVQAPGGTQGFLSTSKVNATSFTITSTNAAETSVVAWELIENP